MLVGAFARDVWFWHRYGIETIRRTEDIDISMAFPDWDSFDAASKALQDNGFVAPDPDCPEQLQDTETDQKLDLIPFGGLSTDGKTITWYSDQQQWGIIGFEDSYHSADLLSIGDKNETIRIATLPAIVTLKLMSFYERLAERKKKDGADIGFILTEYLSIPSNLKRLSHGLDEDIMTLVDGDIRLAGCTLLGRDMARLASTVTRDTVISHLEHEIRSQSNCPLAQETMNYTKGNFNKARNLLTHMLKGYQSIR